MEASEMRKPMRITKYDPSTGDYKPQIECLAIDCDVPRCFALLGSLPGHKRWVERTLVFRPTGANIQFILDNWPSAEWSSEAASYMNDYVSVKMQEQTMRGLKKEQLIDDSGYEFKTVPFPHQRHGFIISRDLRNFAILYEQGCGKTKVAIDTFAYLWEKDEVDVMVVIAPNGVHTNWIVEELPAHLPDRIPAKLLTYHTGANKNERKMLEGESQPYKLRKRRPCTVVAFNVEGFTAQAAKDLITEFLTNHRCLLVVDESNTIQNPGTKRTEFITRVGKLAKYKRILNGTPITEGVENLFSQFRFLDPLILGYDTFTSFKAQFCIMGGFQQHSVVGYKHIEVLADILDGNSHRVLKKDVLPSLPPKLYKRHFFEMSEFQQQAYDAVRRQAIRELQEVFGKENGAKLAQEIALTKLIRLQQITCGWQPFSSGEAAIPLEAKNRRQEALLTLLGYARGKAIIWVNATNSREDIAAIAALLRKEQMGEFVEYHGGVSDAARSAAIKRFQDSDKPRWFLASKAAAVGLTLTAAEQSFYYTNSFSLRIRMQSEDRNHRIGSEIHDSVLYTDIYTTGIDKKIVTDLREKKEIADQITRDPISLFME
jgi:SNF2 family DNA or RNA helicase